MVGGMFSQFHRVHFYARKRSKLKTGVYTVKIHVIIFFLNLSLEISMSLKIDLNSLDL